MKHLWLPSLVLISAMLPGERPGTEAQTISSHDSASAAGPQVTMTVFSDPHFYDPSLGTDGLAFEAYLNNDRKLLRESRELMEMAVGVTLASGSELVLIPGDLTKDGTMASHLRMAGFLGQLEKHGLSVYVVPGNHDVNNGEAMAYRADSTVRVEHVNPVRFEEIYGPYGYQEAISRDPHSLSYLAEPRKNLWILGLDPCLYDHNEPAGHPHTGGAFDPGTMAWLEDQLTSEEAGDKLIIAIMHHGILEHFRGQKRYFGEYVVEDHRKISKKLARLGVKVVFTGHYHANDITMKKWGDGSFLFDIETGSLVTYPCPIRRVEISSDTMRISTEHLDSIPSMGRDFARFAREYVHQGVSGIAERTMIEMNLRPEDAHVLANQIGDAFLSHYQGDEVAKDPLLDLEGVNLKGRMIISFRKKLVDGLYHDLPPSDNELVIHLPSGICR